MWRSCCAQCEAPPRGQFEAQQQEAAAPVLVAAAEAQASRPAVKAAGRSETGGRLLAQRGAAMPTQAWNAGAAAAVGHFLLEVRRRQGCSDTALASACDMVPMSRRS